MRIRIETKLPVERCIQIIENDRARDMKDAEKINKVLDGKSGELGMFQRKAAGAVLSKLLGLMGETKIELLKEEFVARAKEGTIQFVDYTDGVLIINVPDEVIRGAVFRGREKAGLQQLQKQFKATKVSYVEEKQ